MRRSIRKMRVDLPGVGDRAVRTRFDGKDSGTRLCKLKEAGYSSSLINARFAKPLDEEALVRLRVRTG